MKLLVTTLLVVSLQVRNILPSKECGIPQNNTNGNTIVDGSSAAKGAWPWHAVMYRKNGSKETYVCGGTLVSKHHVLTAARCVENADQEKLSVDNMFVRLSVYNLSSTQNIEVQLRQITKIYTARRNLIEENLRNGIAILELASEAKFDSFVQPACLSLKEDFKKHNGTVVGWELNQNDQLLDILKITITPMEDPLMCNNRTEFGEALDMGHFCAGYQNGTAACSGDIGGGLFFNENGAWHLGGVVSFSPLRDDGSNRCATNSYGAFTRIYTYLSWIDSVTKLGIKNGETSAKRYVCTKQTLNYDCQIRNVNLNPNETALFDGDKKNIKTISFKQSTLKYLPASLLNAFSSAELLNTENLGIRTIESNAFANAGRLVRLYLRDNCLTDIHSDTFEGATALEILDLSSNELSNIDGVAFTSLTGLRQLHMAENLIVKLPNFNDNLENLNVSHNQMESIEDNHFTNLRKLQIVDISSNILTKFNMKQFNCAMSIHTIDVSNNSLTELFIPATVQNLYAQKNRIHRAESNQCAVEVLNLAENNLIDQPNLESCSKIVNLDLTSNQIESFDYSKISHMLNLEYLKLAHNRLFEINLLVFPNHPGSVVHLKNLDLSNNQLTNVPSITAFKNLEFLSLRNNNLNFFDFSQMNALKEVLLSNNQWNCESIRSIEHTIRDMDANVYVPVGYSNVSGIHCKESDKALNGQLNEFIYNALMWNNQQWLKEQCSFKTSSINNYKETLKRYFDINTEKGRGVQEIDAIQKEHQKIKSDNNQEKEHRTHKLKYQHKVYRAIENHRISQRMPPEGLVTDQEFLRQTIHFVVEEKMPFMKNLLENRTLEAQESSNQLEHSKTQLETLKTQIFELTNNVSKLSKELKEFCDLKTRCTKPVVRDPSHHAEMCVSLCKQLRETQKLRN